jgi:HEAT repeat protein
LADHGRFVAVGYLDIANAKREVEFREAIGTAIPRLIALLNDNDDDVRSGAASALTKLADHGEFVPINTIQTSLKHSEVKFHDIIMARILFLDGTPPDGHSHVQLDIHSLLRRLADQFGKERMTEIVLRTAVTRTGKREEANPYTC